MSNNNGGPAFPSGEMYQNFSYVTNEKQPYHDGMTLRDYFAAKAMQGLLTSEADAQWNKPALAKFTYEIADAMLAERDKE